MKIPASLRKFFLPVLAAGLAAGCALAVPATFADTTAPVVKEAAPGADTTNFYGTAAKVINMAISAVVLVVSPLSMFAGWLLTPSWSMGDVVNLRPKLHELWILVSNVVYLVFGLALLGIAIANIFGIGGEKSKFAMKSMLPRFVVGLLIVPFTWFLVSATLSVTNMLTASVLQIPGDLYPESASDPFSTIYIAKETTFDFSGDKAQKAAVNCGDTNASTNGDCITLRKALQGNGIYSVLSFYAYSIFQIQTLEEIPGDVIGNIKTMSDLVTHVGFFTVFSIVFSIILVALVFALVARMMWLWIYAIFSPLFGLLHFLGETSFGKKLEEANFSLKEFFSLALVPTYVSAALAFGLIFITGVMGVSNQDSGTTPGTFSDSYATISSTQVTAPAASATPPAGASAAAETTETVTVTFGGLTYNFKGLKKGMTGGAKGAFSVAGGFFGNVILYTISLAVLWLAVMAALKSSKITAAAIEPFEKAGKAIAEFAKHAPLHVPMPGLGVSVNSLGAVASIPQQAMDKKEQAALYQLQGKANKLFGIKDDALNDTIARVGGVRAANDIEARDIVKKLTQAGDARRFSIDPKARNTLADRIGEMKINVTDAELQALRTADTETKIGEALLVIEKKAILGRKEIFDGSQVSGAGIIAAMGKTPDQQKSSADAASLVIASSETKRVMIGKADAEVQAIKLGNREVYTQGGTLTGTDSLKIDDQKAIIAKYLADNGKSSTKEQLESFLANFKGVDFSGLNIREKDGVISVGGDGGAHIDTVDKFVASNKPASS